MSEPKTFVGNGWSSKYGIKIRINKEQIAGLETNKYGEVMLEVTSLRSINAKTKSTHYVAVDDYAYGLLRGDTPVSKMPAGEDNDSGLPF